MLSRIQRPMMHFALSIFLLMVMASVATAYTLVFRDGRRVEIPSDFVVTKVTLTYEISPGFNKTLSLSLLDIPATERANNEVAGSFFKHTQKEQVSPPQSASAPTQHARTTLTNLELEPIAARRIESEKRYERRRVELGLPSVEASRQQREVEESAMLNRARTKAGAEARDEAYWRERARNLRNEIAATDAQISYVRGRLAEIPSSPPGSVTIIQDPGWDIFGRRRVFNPPNVYGYPNVYPIGPNSPFGYSAEYERANLTQRLDGLMTTRAGLAARWQQLEDEARDARVPQIWLEP
jgi:hypothetical protein